MVLYVGGVCAGCGLATAQEPTVALRGRGTWRCADCHKDWLYHHGVDATPAEGPAVAQNRPALASADAPAPQPAQAEAGASAGQPGALAPALPGGSQERKNIPLARGLLDYFPAALAAVAELSRVGNEKHNPGEPMHHARGKSSDHADCILRHLVDRGTTYTETVAGAPVVLRHSTALAWRALALLQEELEAEGLAPLARGAKVG